MHQNSCDRLHFTKPRIFRLPERVCHTGWLCVILTYSNHLGWGNPNWGITSIRLACDWNKKRYTLSSPMWFLVMFYHSNRKQGRTCAVHWKELWLEVRETYLAFRQNNWAILARVIVFTYKLEIPEPLRCFQLWHLWNNPELFTLTLEMMVGPTKLPFS